MSLKPVQLIKARQVNEELKELKRLLKAGTPTTWTAARFAALDHLMKAVGPCEKDCLVVNIWKTEKKASPKRRTKK